MIRTTRVAFGEYVLEPDTRRLLRAGRPVHLAPKAYTLLEALVTGRPRAFSKAELHDLLWPDTFVVEANLSNLIGELRAALGDTREHARCLRTVHGFGYAFCAPVEGAQERDQPASDRVTTCAWLTMEGALMPLTAGAHVLGRGALSVVPLRAPSVSRRHALLRLTPGEATLMDLGSRNGTYVRGRRITASTRLADGDAIRLGPCELTFHGSLTPDTTADLRAALQRAAAGW